MRATVKVWDPLVRLFHWSLVASFAVAWLSADEVKNLHEWAGYAAAALIGFRLVWGVIGPRYARFTQFIRSPGYTLGYFRDLLAGREARFVGHNPLGGLMIAGLLLTMGTTALTGWMQTTDTYWGIEWVKELHETCANAMLALVVLHVGGVVFSSVRHGENLVRSMLTGRKAAAGAEDVA
ncbi:cytochrome b/b6 domain-containing protein [Mesorhizobium sp. ANAO-SY3R2]|uniref:cytochrome b/b6 domain-containing protein n=1 Tax=Mesorhizobium sp. ANAO-SY3R2 TaxID=3166644 RepID=UPI00366AF12F